jgi:hypothetical protein
VIDGGVPRNRRSGFPRPPLLLINTHLKPPPNDLHHRTLPAATARSHLSTQPTLHTTVPFFVSNPAFFTPQSACRTPMCAPSDPTQSARQPSSQHHQQSVSRNVPRPKYPRRECRQRCKASVAVSGGSRRTSHPSFPACHDLIASASNWHRHVRRVLGISTIGFNGARGNIAPIVCLK